ncbi:MAG: tRNA (adenosine(37)-N6)-threonylcarbamoyltransferase complex dimerization subunit type 1 TsaB [Clostridiales bacterium]|nr:tRNA (adenosine(37)-N6)-threonylcarbamoyltransferase complex dimerization subunit type 1 TsaB [Clostridiales bacterium]
MNILALDSSGLAAGVSLVNEEKVLGEFFMNHKKTHSQTLMPLLENMLKVLEFNKRDIDFTAVTSGPGSFTGLRIGMAAAKGLSAALNKPLITVPTLDVLAYSLEGRGELIVPVMDARRGQVYYSIYKQEEESLKRLCSYGAEEIEKVLEEVKEIGGEAVFVGDGVYPYKKQIEEAGFKTGNITQAIQRASCLGALALKAAKEGWFLKPSEAELMYLRKSQAERELEEKKKEVIFRPMKKGDIDSMAEIEKKCFAVPWFKKMILDDYKNGLTYYIICEKGGKVIGYGGMWHVINEGHITNIALTPEEQGRGLGRRLVNEIIKLAKEKHMIGITLEVRAGNKKAIKLYESVGFKPEGIRPEYYSDNKESALIMWKNL